jgi:hypothetical protein
MEEYFNSVKGHGVLSTADSDGKVASALYARPHVMEDGTLAFIMRDRLTHHNLLSNPRAAYLFIEDGKGFKGKRLYLTKIREEKDSPIISELQRRSFKEPAEDNRYLVFFKVDKELPLVGTGE